MAAREAISAILVFAEYALENWHLREIFPVSERRAGNRGYDIMMTDPIADMLTRIRNGILAQKKMVSMPSSKMRHNIARILTEEKFIRGYKIVSSQGPQPTLKVYLRYNEGNAVLKGIQRISKPGCRVYARLDGLPRVRGGLGIAILSTSKGILTDRQAKMLGVGGEVLCYVW